MKVLDGNDFESVPFLGGVVVMLVDLEETCCGRQGSIMYVYSNFLDAKRKYFRNK